MVTLCLNLFQFSPYVGGTPDLPVELDAAARAGFELVGLDTFSAHVEAQRGHTLDNVRAIAETGVDFVSIGALTHSAQALDVSMEVA